MSIIYVLVARRLSWAEFFVVFMAFKKSFWFYLFRIWEWQLMIISN